jgi:hypothetical protein
MKVGELLLLYAEVKEMPVSTRGDAINRQLNRSLGASGIFWEHLVEATKRVGFGRCPLFCIFMRQSVCVGGHPTNPAHRGVKYGSGKVEATETRT